ncbi:DUF421 domain-containing protein [Pontibacter burrus]|uniref:DUF421 domain-containing protein n=1 Tax=Pontibacter burrus TaxID=2704466 RepID=A0A6B3M0P5_9BACT|nr:YetF domain-containing protein [Pontibacter burrus]NEM99424.1 DUF421 domain-containing protein [Pontibacter burrus]
MEFDFNYLFGIGEDTLTWWQMSLRAIGVFMAALLIVRVGNPRVFGKNTAFDIILGIVFGSILSRAITGNSPFWPTLAAALVLVILHRGLATIAYHTSGRFGDFLKGRPVELIKNGKLLHDALQKYSVTENDLQEAVRIKGSTDISTIETAYLERNGNISIIYKK